MKVSDKTYEILRFIAETLLPSITTFVGVVLVALSFKYTEIVITIMAGFDALIGEIVRKLRANYMFNEETLDDSRED